MFDRIMGALGPRVGNLRLSVVQKTPELYLISGLVTGAASAIMLAKAHKKAEGVFEEVIEEIEGVRGYIEGEKKKYETPFPKSTEAKMLMPHVLEGGRQAAVLYGPAVLMAMSSVAFILASHGSLQKRNKALMGTVALIERGFREYRKRVVDEYGEDAEQRLYYGAEGRNVATVEIDPETGKKKKKRSKKNHIPETVSPIIYQRVFDETNINWSPDPDLNDFFLRSTQTQMNDWYDIKGHVVLNDVYRALGFAESPEGCVVGWSKAVPGDGYIVFGLDSDINLREGDNRKILDFNVSGVVYDRVGEV